MNFFTYKIDNIRDKIITMHSSTTVSHQAVHCSLPEEKFDSFIAIGEEEFCKLVNSSKSTTCMLDPIPTKLLKEMLPEACIKFILQLDTVKCFDTICIVKSAI